MKAGTSKQKKYFPIHEIREKLPFPESVNSALLAFHAITGCDKCSLLLFWSHKENGMERVRQRASRLPQHLREGVLTMSKVHDAEEFVCKLYHVENVTKTDEA